MSIRWGRFLAVAVCSAVFALAGCEGDDGDDGAPGAAGADGADGADGSDGLACWDLNGNGVGDFVLDFPPGTEDINGDGEFDAFDCNAAAGDGGTATNPVESCTVCHGAGSIADAVAAHTLPPIEAVSNITFTVNGADLDVSFDLAADEDPALTYDVIQRAYRTDGTFRTDLRVNDSLDGIATLTNNGDGSYLIKVLGGADQAATNNRWLFRVQDSAERETRTYFYADYPASPFAADVSPVAVDAEACANCHGSEGIDEHGGAFIASDGGEVCLGCHGSERLNRDGEVELTPPLALVAHEYHSGLYEERTGEITFPTYMNNCSVCHQTEDQLAEVNAMPVIAGACFSCHGDIDGIPFEEGSVAETIHADFDETTDCQQCHAANDVTDFHNGGTTARGGVIWDGVDTSVTEGAKITWEITDVADDGTDLTITWQATYDDGTGPVGVDPCNDTPAVGAPAFHAIPPFTPPDGEPDDRNNLSILRNYAQGEDFILGTRENRAGQPDGDEDVTTDNTTCSGNVATTVVPVEVTDATVGRVGIQGKPWVVAVDPEDEDGVMQVRAKSPTYDWVIGQGGAASDRRAIVDTTDKCLKCHVGSMYQHGGNRVDNVDLCHLCHNPAANDQYVRVDTFGVDASEAYDGQAGEVFGMKTMLHAVHASGRTAYSDVDHDPAQIPFVIYRGRGIYAWAADESLLPNWPTEDDCVRSNGSPGRTVFGADDPTATSSCQLHNFHRPTFPRGLYDCGACHEDGFNTLFPDATKAMASTVETGDEPFGDRLNDVLEGASSATCTTCHKQWSAADRAEYNAIGAHAAQNGWEPQAFEEGRQTIIEANQ